MPSPARREGKSTPRKLTVCALNILGGLNTTSHLGSGECNARARVGFKHAYDVLLQQVDRHRQQNDILTPFLIAHAIDRRQRVNETALQ